MIKIENISKSYDGKLIVKNFSLTLNKNSHTTLLGSSGIGKTTLLKIISGLEKPDSGTISNNFTSSILFQEDRLIEYMNAVDNVSFVLDNPNKNLIIQTLKLLGIEDVTNKPVSLFSGGMKRRVSICRALLYQSDLLILDEPFRSLDKETISNIIPVINSFSNNRIILSVLHHPDYIDKLKAIPIYL